MQTTPPTRTENAITISNTDNCKTRPTSPLHVKTNALWTKFAVSN